MRLDLYHVYVVEIILSNLLKLIKTRQFKLLITQVKET